MTAEDQTSWSPEQLEEWARPALEHPGWGEKLAEIARTVPSNNQAKDQTLAWITKIHEPLGQATRWAHILYEKYPERFEKLVSQIKQKPQEAKEMGDIREIEFPLPRMRIETIIREQGAGMYHERNVSIRFIGGVTERTHAKSFCIHEANSDALDFCLLILEKISPQLEDARDRADYARRVIKLCKILEGKFGLEPFIEVLEKAGLKVKTRENCKHLKLGWCFVNPETPQRGELIKCPCEKHWAPKEVEEKKEGDPLLDGLRRLPEQTR